MKDFARPLLPSFPRSATAPWTPRPKVPRARGTAIGVWMSLLGAVVMLAALPVVPMQGAATLTTLYNFSNSAGGMNPYAGLVQGTDGNFYGTTAQGGSSGYGTVFKITPSGTLTNLHDFSGTNDGSAPQAELVQGGDGNFYGTTNSGGINGNGTVFRISPAGAFATLYRFTGTDGSNPLGALVQASDGNFYGTTSSGGSNNYGTVFKITPSGSLTTLVTFNGSINGGNPDAGLTLGSDGNFYGTTYTGGANTSGTVFRVTPTGTLTTLHNFTYGSDGAQPKNALVLGSDGNFYGTTNQGGANSYGTIFQMTPAGVLTTLYAFTGAADGLGPQGRLTEGSDGYFYGATAAGAGNTVEGSIYRINPAGNFSTVHGFATGNDGNFPQGSIVLGSDGNYYGTTNGGGSSNAGTIYRLTVPTGPPVPGSLQFSAGTSTVTETAGSSASFLVNRVGGSDGSVQVRYTTVDDTAVAGVDYQAASGTLTWRDGDTSPKAIVVPIINRNLTSGSTRFFINLFQPGGASLGAPVQAAVTILDTTGAVASLQSVTLLSPPNGVTVTQGQPLVIQASVAVLANKLGGVGIVARDSAGNSAGVGAFSSQRGQVTWVPPAPGDYTLQAIATDTDGNSQVTNSVIHVVAAQDAGTPPMTNLYGGLDGRTVALNDTVPVVAQAVDTDGNPLQNAQFFLDGVPVPTSPVPALPAGFARGPDVHVSADSALDTLIQTNVTISQIEQLLTVLGTNAQGVSVVSNASTLYGKGKAGTPPTAIIANLINGANLPANDSNQVVSVQADSGDQPLAQVELIVDNQSVGVATSAPFAFNLPPLAAGSHVLSAIATAPGQAQQGVGPGGSDSGADGRVAPGVLHGRNPAEQRGVFPVHARWHAVRVLLVPG